MWPKIKMFFTDAATFDSQWDRWVAKVRGIIMLAGAAVTAYGDQITASLPPQWAPRFKLAGVLLMAGAVMFRAGDKNPR